MAIKPVTFSRRSALNRGIEAVLPAAHMTMPSWMPRLSVATGMKAGPKGDVLVVIFLRGGADGLSMIVPHGDANYYKARPTINMARPDDGKADKSQKSLDLDGFFGVHPVMAPLLPFFQGKKMTAVHATGSTNGTRSHFEAMDFMERGEQSGNTLSTGWIGRHLSSLQTETNGLRAIGWGDALPMSLRGSINALALRSITDYHLSGNKESADKMLASLNALYNVEQSALQGAANQTKTIVDLLKKINIDTYMPANGATYNQNSGLDMALKQTAALIKGDVGLEVSAIDYGGWDMHISLLPAMTRTLGTLSNALAAFATDLGDALNKVTIVVMSEFGRRVGENADAGLDHGHGNAMLLMGGNVATKPVVAKWPGLDNAKLDSGDLAITIDYRDVLSEILSKRLMNNKTDLVFPGYKPVMPGAVR